jgi:hypothetical protein
LRAIADRALAELERNYEKERPSGDDSTLGWVPASVFQKVWRRAIDEDIRAPLVARGLASDPGDAEAGAGKL